jgi:DNA-binding LacI/PurR family transcriptional regulator
MTKPATIKDVAASAGVSSSAVSAVLGHNPSRHVRVSEQTRSRILEAAARIHYQPNRAARSLRSKRTNVLGVYTAQGYLNPYMPFTSQIIGGLHLGCDAAGKDLLLHGMYRGRPAEEILAELTGGQIDGLILYTRPEDPLVPLLAASALPVISVVDALPGLPTVVADDAAGSALLAAHLAARGHRRIVYVAGSPTLVSAMRRLEAFQAAAATLGMEIMEFHPSSHHERFAEGELTWLDLPPPVRPTAAVCWNDLAAYFLLEECRRLGVCLPGDLAVAGFDGIVPPHSGPLRLTTIHAPWTEVARAAIPLLVRLIDGEAIAPETRLPVTFVPGDTA